MPIYQVIRKSDAVHRNTMSEQQRMQLPPEMR